MSRFCQIVFAQHSIENQIFFILNLCYFVLFNIATESSAVQVPFHSPSFFTQTCGLHSSLGTAAVSLKKEFSFNVFEEQLQAWFH